MIRSLALGAVASALFLLTQTASARESCSSGVQTRGGHRVHVYCGPATATVQFKGRRVVFQSGTCEREYDGVFVVDLGIAELLSLVRPRYRFFELKMLATRDGTYRKLPGVVPRIEWNVFRARMTMLPSVVRIAGGMTRGTFAGKLADGTQASGSFTC
jgi:hypothetical protein